VRVLSAFGGLTSVQRKTFTASFLGWTLDAFDFFLVTFVLVRLAADFHKTVVEVSVAITLTLAFRPLGALIFGWIADRFGRRTPLMIDIAIYSLLELLTAFSPNLTVFLILRALYGIAMGGEWGLGAALAMESLPAQKRGLFSGILQEGYMVGYLLAALAYFLVFTYTHWDWRGLFVIGVLPALLIFYIRAHVPESPVWQAAQNRRPAGADLWQTFKLHAPLVIYVILFMSALNFMSHVTQDLYATFLQKQHGFSTGQTSLVSIIAAIGAIAGGMVFGSISQRFGRRNTIVVCGVLGILVVPLWAFSQTIAMLALGGFAMQFMVQGAWGVIPAHLNELSPPDARGTFPGLTYQIGNLISAGAVTIAAGFAKSLPLASGQPDYAKALGIIALIVLTAVVLFTAVGYFVAPEKRDVDFAATVPES
jgi:SHS family lactate transporter-like MFS transporter